MAFDWMTPKVSPEFAKKIASRFDEAGRDEIEQRARLLARLGFDRNTVVGMIQRRITWEFELSKLPGFYKDIAKITDRVFRRDSR
jgi:hypothetical protein